MKSVSNFHWSQAMTWACLISLCVGTSDLSAQQPVPRAAHRAIVGWDDSVICVGPGTVAGMDSPAAIQQMVKRWKARGYQGIYWRVDELMLPERFAIKRPGKSNPAANYLTARIENVLHEFPVLKTLQAECDAEGVELWAWYPTIYSNGAPPTGPGFTQEWQYESRFAVEHPEVLTVDRAGNKQFMVWEYAYPEARAAKVSEFVEFARDFGFKRFVACLRTEAAQMQPPPKHADQFGFNAPVVEAMQKQFGVNILTDARFDYTDSKFNVNDPMLENWRKLRGGYLTQFYRELRAALNEVDPSIQIAVQIPGDRAFTCLGNWTMDWRTWIDEGLVNELVVPVVHDNYEGYGATANLKSLGYLDGSVPIEFYRETIRKSRQPTARVIHAGGPATSYDPPPPHTDGWRIDQWFDLWCYNQAERWEQWQRDVSEFGHIKFMEQSFDDFPEGKDGHGGGWGDFAHRPDLRSGPGYWTILGDGKSMLPFAQSQVRRGTTGRAIQMTRDANGAANLQARHHGRSDRSNYPFPGDTAISNGTATLSCWLYRPDETSACIMQLQNENDPEHRHEVGVYLPVGSPSTVHFVEGGKYVASKATMPIRIWQKVVLTVDLERKVYSAELAAEGQPAQLICQNIKYAAKENAFNVVEISPQGATGSVFFLDDLALRWQLEVHATSPGQQIVVRDGFEAARPGQTIQQLGTQAGERWKLTIGQPSDVTIDRDVSFGAEYQSLRFRGAGGRATLGPKSLTYQPDDVITVDLDLLLKSDLRHIQLTPLGSARGSDDVLIGLKTIGNDRPLIELRIVDGRWHCGGGKLADTGLDAAFDAWNHIQLAVDTARQTYRLSLQVIGEAPRMLHEGKLESPPVNGESLTIELGCLRKQPRSDGPAFDNLLVTRKSTEKTN